MDIEEIRAKAEREEFVLSYHAHEERQAEAIGIEARLYPKATKVDHSKIKGIKEMN